MAWTPISGAMLQYSKSDNTLASDYYLKFYQSGTSTAFNMATDSTGGTTLDKCQLDSSGYPTTDGSTRFIPHINQEYKIALYKNSTDADADTTANADWIVDSISQVQTGQTDAWVLFPGTPTRTGNTTFTLTGDQTGTFTADTRVKFTDSSTLYGNVVSSSFSSVTTVTVVLDSGNLSASLTEVYTSISDTTSEPIGSASVNYLPAGSSAVVSNVQTKLREVVNATDYGWVSDSTGAYSSGTFDGTDNSAAFQAACEYAYSIGASVELPAGKARLGAITYTGVSIHGHPGRAGTQLYVDDGIWAIQVGATSGGSYDAPAGVTEMPTGTNLNLIKISGLAFNGSSSYTTGSGMIRNIAGHSLFIRDIYANYMGGPNINMIECRASGSGGGVGFSTNFHMSHFEFANCQMGNGGASSYAAVYMYDGDTAWSIKNGYISGVQAFDDNGGSPLKPDTNAMGIITLSSSTSGEVFSVNFEKLGTCILHNGVAPMTISNGRAEQIKDTYVKSNRSVNLLSWRGQVGNKAPTTPFIIGATAETFDFGVVEMDSFGTTAGATPTSDYQQVDIFLDVTPNGLSSRLDCTSEVPKLALDTSKTAVTDRIDSSTTTGFGVLSGLFKNHHLLLSDGYGGANNGDLAPSSIASNVKGSPHPSMIRKVFDGGAQSDSCFFDQSLVAADVSNGSTNPVMEFQRANTPAAIEVVISARQNGGLLASLYSFKIVSVLSGDSGASSVRWGVSTVTEDCTVGAGIGTSNLTFQITDNTSETAELTITNNTGSSVRCSVMARGIGKYIY